MTRYSDRLGTPNTPQTYPLVQVVVPAAAGSSPIAHPFVPAIPICQQETGTVPTVGTMGSAADRVVLVCR
jgi:hypothetical protein